MHPKSASLLPRPVIWGNKRLRSRLRRGQALTCGGAGQGCSRESVLWTERRHSWAGSRSRNHVVTLSLA